MKLRTFKMSNIAAWRYLWSKIGELSFELKTIQFINGCLIHRYLIHSFTTYSLKTDSVAVTVPNAMNKAGRNPCIHGVYLFTAQNQGTPLPSEVKLVIPRRSLLLKKESWLDTRNSLHPRSGFTSTSVEWAVTETTEASRASEMRQGTQGTDSAEMGPMNTCYILCVLGAGTLLGQRE